MTRFTFETTGLPPIETVVERVAARIRWAARPHLRSYDARA